MFQRAYMGLILFVLLGVGVGIGSLVWSVSSSHRAAIEALQHKVDSMHSQLLKINQLEAQRQSAKVEKDRAITSSVEHNKKVESVITQQKEEDIKNYKPSINYKVSISLFLIYLMISLIMFVVVIKNL